MSLRSNLIGQRFGRLVVVGLGDKRPDGKLAWVCECDCGGTTTTVGYKLKSGHTQSCGCLLGEHCRRYASKAASVVRHDLTGLRFGRLLVVAPALEQEGQSYRWLCRCDCGNETYSTQNALSRGMKVSCGCRLKEHAASIGRLRARNYRISVGADPEILLTTSEKRFRNKFTVANVRLQCFARDNYTCKLCGARGVRLAAHHLVPWQTAPELRFELTNLVTLCNACHLVRLHQGNCHGPVDPELTDMLQKQSCSACGTEHDRDVNASRNILIVGLGHQTPIKGIPRL